jgi:hypothetical protein
MIFIAAVAVLFAFAFACAVMQHDFWVTRGQFHDFIAAVAGLCRKAPSATHCYASTWPMVHFARFRG